ncbi:MAG TPA: hypothetical protein VIA62_21845 [Thermoanaerobaculia bacterium]|jgi:hypothetical protein|nr:hypothetical protein [Thermoanaerobaculia bacterium]
MRAVVQDREALLSMLPVNMAAYLRTHGWQEIQKESGRYSIWSRSGGPRGPQILLPLRRDFEDYAIRASQVLAAIEQVEDRSQLEILRDISTIFADVIRIRSKHDQLRDGSVPLDGGVALTRASRDLLLAAACATISAKPFFTTRKPDDALRYVEGLRMGQTEQGSFVLTIQSPVTPDLQGDLLPEQDSDPFERKVTKTLMRALASLGDAAEQSAATGSIKPFEDAVHLGVSANLCDALANLQEETAAESVEVRMSWAPVRPMEEPEIRASVVVPQEVMPLIREASRVFRDFTPQEDVEIDGLVTVLKREDDSEGIVTITGWVEGRPRKIRVFLSGSDYDRAIEAHRLRALVHCEGNLIKEGRSYRLQEPHDFSIEETPGEGE